MIIIWVLLAVTAVTLFINIYRHSGTNNKEFGMVERRKRALAVMKSWKEH